MRDWAVTGGFALIGMTIGAVVAGGIVMILGFVGLESASEAGFELAIITAIIFWFATSIGAVTGASIGGTIGGRRVAPEGRKRDAGINGCLLGLLIGIVIGIPVILGLLLLLGQIALNTNTTAFG